MKKITAFLAATALSASMAGTAFAGSALPVEEEPEPSAVPAAGSGLGTGAIIAGVAAIALIAALASSDDSSSTTTTGSGT